MLTDITQPTVAEQVAPDAVVGNAEENLILIGGALVLKNSVSGAHSTEVEATCRTGVVSTVVFIVPVLFAKVVAVLLNPTR